QARCFESYRRVFEKEPWLLGFSIFAIGENSEDKNFYPSEETTKVIKKK
ncbi:hydrolase, partial [Clostridium sporogenes]